YAFACAQLTVHHATLFQKIKLFYLENITAHPTFYLRWHVVDQGAAIQTPRPDADLLKPYISKAIRRQT
ncbi:MAG: hypothetical protein P8104_02445, partial [Gammaproteobacteria bacterium]